MATKGSERDWVDSLIEEAPQKSSRFSYQDSAFDLKDGCDVDELDTIPAELLDLLK